MSVSALISALIGLFSSNVTPSNELKQIATPKKVFFGQKCQKQLFGVAICVNSLGGVILELNRPMRAEIKTETLLFMVVNFCGAS